MIPNMIPNMIFFPATHEFISINKRQRQFFKNYQPSTPINHIVILFSLNSCVNPKASKCLLSSYLFMKCLKGGSTVSSPSSVTMSSLSTLAHREPFLESRDTEIFLEAILTTPLFVQIITKTTYALNL